MDITIPIVSNATATAPPPVTNRWLIEVTAEAEVTKAADTRPPPADDPEPVPPARST